MNNEINWRKAKELAITETRIRKRWAEDQFEFWTQRLIAEGDDEAIAMTRWIGYFKVFYTKQLAYLEEPNTLVGTHWLLRSMPHPFDEPCKTPSSHSL